ncbi:MAG: 8-amino-7-oxononanoate synthase [Sphingomonadaceae bacterium]|nr:8-amino-7-oxononanoate synthase [Sphingomonadaceae bacterium]
MAHLLTYRENLDSLTQQSRFRQLRSRQGIDFASNDYLGLASSERLTCAAENALARNVALGSGGSRLLRGNDPEHEVLESEAAAFFGCEAALYLSSGYAANLAVFATLPQREDTVFYDELVHASALDGMRLGRANCTAVRHNDASAFEAAIVDWRRGGGKGAPWIAVESLYSMDGDQARVEDLAAIADRHDGFLVVDEAHATGVMGARGRGLTETLEGRHNLVTLHTCGKALGCEGALLCLPSVLRDFLVNRARSFIFSTAPSPLMAAIVREALRIVEDESERRERLWAMVRHGERAFARSGVVPTGSPILPLILGDDVRTMEVAGALQEAGFDVRGIRPPTVPAGTSRLRISLTLNASEADVTALGAVLEEVLQP